MHEKGSSRYKLPRITIKLPATLTVLDSLEAAGQTNTELYKALRNVIAIVNRRNHQ